MKTREKKKSRRPALLVLLVLGLIETRLKKTRKKNQVDVKRQGTKKKKKGEGQTQDNNNNNNKLLNIPVVGWDKHTRKKTQNKNKNCSLHLS